MNDNALTQFLINFPKVDIHYHMLSGVRLQTMCDIARKNNISLSYQEATQYYRGFQKNNEVAKGGIEALYFLYDLIRDPYDYQRILYEIAEDAQQTGVRYLELFWNPSDTVIKYKIVLQALADAIEQIEQNLGLVIRLIPAINREKSIYEAERMVDDVLHVPSKYVVGIGIDYKEEKGLIEKFKPAFDKAAQGGLHLTGHCGELDLSWTNIKTALDVVGLERIDHGYTVIDDNEFCDRCVQEKIPFTVVPSNTYFINKWPSYSEWRKNHPIIKMAEKGLIIIPGTDDWHIHNTNAFKMYQSMVRDFKFDIDSIYYCMVNGIDASWAPIEYKRKWRNEWPTEFKNLRKTLDNTPSNCSEGYLRYRPKRTSEICDL